MNKATTQVDNCTQQLRRAILSGELAVGERLAPERRLAERLKVGRVTVRSALGRLAAEGLLAVRQGSGYTVRDFRRHGGPGLLEPILDIALEDEQLPELAAELMMVRRLLLAGLLERLCSSSNEARRRRIADAVASFASLLSREASKPQLAEAENAIYDTLLQTAGSVVIGLSLKPLLAVIYSDQLRDAVLAAPEENLAAWHKLLGWLERPTLNGIPVLIDEQKLRDERAVTELDATIRWSRVARA